jgi:hypothetical protein
MAVDGLEHAPFRPRNHRRLAAAIGRRKEHVGLDRQHEGPGLDSLQNGGEVAVGVARDIGPLPFPRHTEQIIGVHWPEIAVHETVDESLNRVEAQRFRALLHVKFGAPAHHGPKRGLILFRPA